MDRKVGEAIQVKGTVLTLKDSYQEFKCLANDNFVSFCKMKIGSSVGNYGSLIQCKYKEKYVCLSLKCSRGFVCVCSPK